MTLQRILVVLLGLVPGVAVAAAAVVVDDPAPVVASLAEREEPTIEERVAPVPVPEFLSAGEAVFLLGMDDLRPPDVNSPDLLAMGYEVCDRLDEGNSPVVLAERIIEAHVNGDVSDERLLLFTAVMFEAAAADSLCVEHSAAVSHLAVRMLDGL